MGCDCLWLMYAAVVQLSTVYIHATSSGFNAALSPNQVQKYFCPWTCQALSKPEYQLICPGTLVAQRFDLALQRIAQEAVWDPILHFRKGQETTALHGTMSILYHQG